MNNIIRQILVVFSLTSLLSLCVIPQIVLSQPRTKTAYTKTAAGNIIMSGPIVGIGDKDSPFSMRQSIQDYYIKFCESKVSQEQFKRYYSELDSLMKIAKLEVEFRHGNLDNCEANETDRSFKRRRC